MARKSKKRREERRQRKQRQEARAAAGEAPVEQAEETRRVEPDQPDQPVQKTARKKRKKRAGPRFRINGWYVGVPVAAAAVIAVVVLIVTSGSSGTNPPSATPVPDPRVQGFPIVATVPVNAGGGAADAFFSPREITGPAGEAFEIIVSNTGSLSHNLTIAGVDGEYGTSDDWSTVPQLFTPGEQGRVVVKLDEPGVYVFRCVIHPDIQTGELTIQ